MKKVMISILTICLLVLVGCNKQEVTPPKETSVLKLYAKDQIELTLSTFWSNKEKTHPYAMINTNNQPINDATLWDYGALFTSAVRYYRLYDKDEESKVIFDRIMEGLKWYKSLNRNDDYTVYASQNGDEEPVFYDDNVWLVIGLLDAYDITKDEKYLNEAILIQEYIYTGWVEDIQGDPYKGGLLWREYKKDDKGNYDFSEGDIARNACINGPAAMASALIYKLTNDEIHLNWAVKIYDWTVRHLRNNRGLYFDHVYYNSEGQFGINETVYSYNTGTMISAGVYLYEITQDKTYLDQAVESAQTYQTFKSSSIAENPNAKLYLSENEPWFRVYLFNGFLDLAKHDLKYSEFIEKSVVGMKHLYENGLDSKGFLFKKWGLDQQETRMNELRHISGNLESLIIFAEYETFVKEGSK